MDGILIAIITGACVAVPSVIATVVSNNKSHALVIYRLDQLEEKQNKHNKLMERTFKIEGEIRGINRTLDDLRK